MSKYNSAGWHPNDNSGPAEFESGPAIQEEKKTENFWYFWRKYIAAVEGKILSVLFLAYFGGTPFIVATLGYNENAVLPGYAIGMIIFCIFAFMLLLMEFVAWKGNDICPHCYKKGIQRAGERKWEKWEWRGGCSTDVSGYCYVHSDMRDCSDPVYYTTTMITITYFCPFCGKDHQQNEVVDEKFITYKEYVEKYH